MEFLIEQPAPQQVAQHYRYRLETLHDRLTPNQILKLVSVEIMNTVRPSLPLPDAEKFAVRSFTERYGHVVEFCRLSADQKKAIPF